MRTYKGKIFSPKTYVEFVKIIGNFEGNYINIGSEAADLIEHIIDAFKANNPKFKEKYFREQVQIIREQKRREIESSLRTD
jgi:hypothetical protein